MREHSKHLWPSRHYHFLESAKVAAAVVVVAEDGEGDEAIAVLELVLSHHLLEELCHFAWRRLEGTTAEGTQHEAVVSLEQSQAEDGAYLVTCDDLAVLRDMAVRGETDRKMAAHVECSIGDDTHLEGFLHQRIVGTGLTEDGDGRRIDDAEVERLGDRIVIAVAVLVAILDGIPLVEALDGTRQRAATADGLLLGSCPRLHATARMTATGEVQQGRTITLPD